MQQQLFLAVLLVTISQALASYRPPRIVSIPDLTQSARVIERTGKEWNYLLQQAFQFRIVDDDGWCRDAQGCPNDECYFSTTKIGIEEFIARMNFSTVTIPPEGVTAELNDSKIACELVRLANNDLGTCKNI